jgi:hypothetical protein
VLLPSSTACGWCRRPVACVRSLWALGSGDWGVCLSSVLLWGARASPQAKPLAISWDRALRCSGENQRGGERGEGLCLFLLPPRPLYAICPRPRQAAEGRTSVLFFGKIKRRSNQPRGWELVGGASWSSTEHRALPAPRPPYAAPVHVNAVSMDLPRTRNLDPSAATLGAAGIFRLSACTDRSPSLALGHASVEVVRCIFLRAIKTTSMVAEGIDGGALRLGVVHPCAATAHRVQVRVGLLALAVTLRQSADRIRGPLSAAGASAVEAAGMLSITAQRSAFGCGCGCRRVFDECDAATLLPYLRCLHDMRGQTSQGSEGGGGGEYNPRARAEGSSTSSKKK